MYREGCVRGEGPIMSGQAPLASPGPLRFILYTQTHLRSRNSVSSHGYGQSGASDDVSLGGRR